MLEKLTYINHLNERIDMGTGGIYVNTHELRNYEWSIVKQNNRITELNHGVSKRRLPLVIVAKTHDEAVAIRNRLFAVIEKDTVAQKYGKLIIGDYYLSCYVTKSVKRQWLRSPTGRFMTLDLTMTTDSPMWVKEKRHVLRKLKESGEGGQNWDFPFDFMFDFKSDTGSEKIVNPSIAASNFRMIFYGACIDPEVEIGGHLYKVLGEVGEREYVTIDSAAKTVYLTKEDGTKVNWFNNRYRRSYIFEPLPSGSVNVFWGGVYGIDVITFDERSEPEWI